MYEDQCLCLLAVINYAALIGNSRRGVRRLPSAKGHSNIYSIIHKPYNTGRRLQAANERQCVCPSIYKGQTRKFPGPNMVCSLNIPHPYLKWEQVFFYIWFVKNCSSNNNAYVLARKSHLTKMFILFKIKPVLSCLILTRIIASSSIDEKTELKFQIIQNHMVKEWKSTAITYSLDIWIHIPA